jgi:probable selenium-dependent hydroxylase accessory protein YqeC
LQRKVTQKEKALRTADASMLSNVLPVRAGMITALVGAGGKTTTMFRLAAELTTQGKRVITTTTTHIFPPDAGQTEALIFAPTRALLLERAAAALAAHAHITIAAEPTPEGKLLGLPPAWVTDLRTLPGIETILVEADGAKGRMLKAPAAHEPVIPPGADLVLLLASASVLGQPLNEAIAHRVEQITAVTGLAPGEIITAQALATLATSDHGLLKGLPPAASAILVLTHLDQQRLQEAQTVATLALASQRLAGVLLCSLEWATYLSSEVPPELGTQ